MRLFLRLLPILIFVAVVCGVAIALWARMHRSPGFKDFLKNPARWREMVAEEDDLEREIKTAQTWNASQVSRAVRQYVFDGKPREGWAQKQVLRSLGERTQPAALALLREPSLRKKLTTFTGEDLWREAPFERLVTLLGDQPPPEAIEALGTFLADPAPEIRRTAAGSVAKIGTIDIIDPVSKALHDADEHVRSHTLAGLEEAAQGGRLDQRCKRALFEDVQALVGRPTDADYATRVLLEFDAARALEVFLSPAFFHAASGSLHEALEALAEHKTPVPRERLLALIGELETTKLEYPKNYALGEALRLLGQLREAEDQPFLEARMSHREEQVARGASAGLLACHGFEDIDEKIGKREEAGGWGALSKEQQYLSAVIEVDAEVNNGGHSQYFFNSSGDQWREAMAGLEAMGFTQRAAIFRETVARFGKDGPSTDRATRQDQLAKLERKNDKLFDALDDRYYACKEIIDAYTTRYVIKNAAAFR